MDGLGLREKRCLELSVTAVWMSVKVALRDWRRRHLSCGGVSLSLLNKIVLFMLIMYMLKTKGEARCSGSTKDLACSCEVRSRFST